MRSVPWLSRLSLRSTLVLVMLAMVALVSVAIAGVTHVSASNHINALMNQELQRAVDRVERFDAALIADDAATAQPATPTALEPPAPDAAAASVPAFVSAPGQGEFMLGAIIYPNDAIEAGYVDLNGDVVPLAQEDRDILAALTPSRRTRDVQLDVGEYRLAVLRSDDGSRVVTGVSITDSMATLQRLNMTLIGVSLAALTATGLLGWAVIRRTMLPLDEVAQVAQAVASADLTRGTAGPSERVSERVSAQRDEVGAVARALNHALDNVSDSLSTRHTTEMRVRQFVADASHELRTPLTSVRGYADLLRLTVTDPQVQSSVDRILSQTDRMRGLVEDMLLLARLDQDALTTGGQEEFDLGELLAEALMDAQVVATDHDFTLDIPDTPLPVYADVRLVERLLTNVVSNARKHTPAGTSVTLRARESHGRALVTIEDTGPGMPPELVATIFDRFTRADMSRTGKEGSSGLGMSIAHAVAQRIGGSIRVTSAPGEGTAVHIDLPLMQEHSFTREIAAIPLPVATLEDLDHAEQPGAGSHENAASTPHAQPRDAQPRSQSSRLGVRRGHHRDIELVDSDEDTERARHIRIARENAAPPAPTEVISIAHSPADPSEDEDVDALDEDSTQRPSEYLRRRARAIEDRPTGPLSPPAEEAPHTR